MSYPPVTLRSFELLRELKRNNERAWFQAHKAGVGKRLRVFWSRALRHWLMGHCH